MSSTQEIVELILDANRNNLLALDLKVSIMTMGLGAGALFAGLFGMNVRPNFYFIHWRHVTERYPFSWKMEWKAASLRLLGHPLPL